MALSLKEGRRIWWAALPTTGTSTPVVTEDAIYVAAYNSLGEPTLKTQMPTFDVLLADHDSDTDGAVDRDEIPDDLYLFQRPEIGAIRNTELKFRVIFGSRDLNQDGVLDRDEWDAFRKWYDDLDSHGMVKLKRGGQGNVTLTHVAWKENRAVPAASR